MASAEAQLREWRRDRYQELGFDDVVVQLLVEWRVDWHQLSTLLEQGCAHALAVRIVCPVDHLEKRKES